MWTSYHNFCKLISCTALLPVSQPTNFQHNKINFVTSASSQFTTSPTSGRGSTASERETRRPGQPNRIEGVHRRHRHYHVQRLGIWVWSLPAASALHIRKKDITSCKDSSDLIHLYRNCLFSVEKLLNVAGIQPSQGYPAFVVIFKHTYFVYICCCMKQPNPKTNLWGFLSHTWYPSTISSGGDDMVNGLVLM